MSQESSDFDLLMGKGTKHWNYLTKNDDIATLQKFKSLYDQNQNLRFSKESPYKIPPTVHFIWLGPKSFPPESVENVRTWIAQNPGWTFKFWTDRDRDPPCKGMETIVFTEFPFPRMGKYYNQSENWGEKSDLLRFEILFHEGGIYVDHDANCLQPFDGLHKGYDFYCGLEPPHPEFAGYALTTGIGVLASSPNHPTLARVMDRVASHWNSLAQKYPGTDGYSKTQIVLERTYLPLTQVLKEFGPGDVGIIFPAAYFFAKAGMTPLYSKHFFSNSWAGGKKSHNAFEQESKRQLARIDSKISLFSFVGGATLLMTLLMMVMIFKVIKKRSFS